MFPTTLLASLLLLPLLPTKTTVLAAQPSLTPLTLHPAALPLPFHFNPTIPAYWTHLPHHRRTPLTLSPDGKTAYLAYLDASGSGVHVLKIDPLTFAPVGEVATIEGAREAGGLVVRDDGFALLTNIPLPAGTANAPPDDTPVPILVRYKNSAEAWRTWLGGPSAPRASDGGLSASPDLNGDLVYSETAGLYGAYFVITDYQGPASGHFGDSVQYVDDEGTLREVEGTSKGFGCSHNTGIAFEGADEVPFASVCAEDHGAIWLNTKTQSMAGVKLANENTINGASEEPMGAMSGSYSALARLPTTPSYLFVWPSRGCVNLTPDAWMGAGYTQCSPRRLNRNAAVMFLKDKSTVGGTEASSVVGAASGDDQLTWLTTGEDVDHTNVHVAALDARYAVVTWEEISQPDCTTWPAMGCSGTYSGTVWILVDTEGGVVKQVGEAVRADNVFVAGDMVRWGDGSVCWPFVDGGWDLSKPVEQLPGREVTAISLACIGMTNAAPSSTVQPASAPTASPPADDKAIVGARANRPAYAPKREEPASGHSVLPDLLLTSTVFVIPVPCSLESSTTPTGQPVPTPTMDCTAADCQTSPLSSAPYNTADAVTAGSSSSSVELTTTTQYSTAFVTITVIDETSTGSPSGCSAEPTTTSAEPTTTRTQYSTVFVTVTAGDECVLVTQTITPTYTATSTCTAGPDRGGEGDDSSSPPIPTATPTPTTTLTPHTSIDAVSGSPTHSSNGTAAYTTAAVTTAPASVNAGFRRAKAAVVFRALAGVWRVVRGGRWGFVGV